MSIYPSPGERASHLALPDEVSGYAFDPKHSWWSVILPESSRNMIINPSFEAWPVEEYAVAGWDSSDYEEFVAVQASVGKRCARLSLDSGTGTITYDEGLLVTPGPYTFSLDIHSPRDGVVVSLQVRNTSVVVAQATRTLRSGWQRVDLTYTEVASGTRQARLSIAAVSATLLDFYTDAWQFEAKPYATTYLDGDMVGLSDTKPRESYYWIGTPHRSVSVRRETTANGGRVVSWSARAMFRTTSIIGLDMAPVESRLQVMADGGEINRGSYGFARPFTITGRIFANNYPELRSRIKELVALLKPNNTLAGEQMILRYQYVNAGASQVGQPLDIACSYNSGLDGTVNGFYQQNLPIQFRASQPYPQSPFENSAELELYKPLIKNNIIFKDEFGEFQNLGSGNTDAFPIVVGFLRDGSPVAFGPFTELAGDAVEDAAYWDGAQWQQLGALGTYDEGDATDSIDGYLTGYPLTTSTTLGSVAEFDEESATWNFLGDGMLGPIYAIARDAEGNIWAGGQFEFAQDGTTVYNNVAKWSIIDEEWQPVGDGLTDPGELFPDLEVYTVLADDGYVYFGGWFQQGDSVNGIVSTTTLANKAIRYDPVANLYAPMGYGFNAAPNQFIRGRDGYIYAVGGFSQDGTESYDLRGFARWNGYQWEEIFPLQKLNGDYGADGMTLDEDGIFWFYNYVTSPEDDLFVVPTLGNVGTFGWRNGVFYPALGNVSITHMSVGPGNRTIYAVRGTDSEDFYTVPALINVEYEGEADAPAVLHIYGQSMPVQCVNLDTKGGVYFRSDLILGPEEEVILRSDTQRALAYSHARHNLIRYVSTGGSSLRALRLRPGNNRISVFARNITSEDAAMWLTWKNRFWGVE